MWVCYDSNLVAVFTDVVIFCYRLPLLPVAFLPLPFYRCHYYRCRFYRLPSPKYTKGYTAYLQNHHSSSLTQLLTYPTLLKLNILWRTG